MPQILNIDELFRDEPRAQAAGRAVYDIDELFGDEAVQPEAPQPPEPERLDPQYLTSEQRVGQKTGELLRGAAGDVADLAQYAGTSLARGATYGVSTMAGYLQSAREGVSNIGQDIIFWPLVKQMYPEKYAELAKDPQKMQEAWEFVRAETGRNVPFGEFVAKAVGGQTMAEREESRYFQEALQSELQKAAPLSETAQKAAEEGDILNPAYIFENSIRTGTDLAAAVGANYLTGGSAGLPLLIGKAAGAVREDALQRLRSQGVPETDAAWAAEVEAALTVPIIAAAERFTLGTFAPSKFVQENLAKAARTKLGQVAASGFAEGTAEVIEEIAGTAAQSMVEQDPTAFQGLQRRLIESAMFGAIGGAGARAAIPTQRVQKIVDRHAQPVAETDAEFYEDVAGVPRWQDWSGNTLQFAAEYAAQKSQEAAAQGDTARSSLYQDITGQYQQELSARENVVNVEEVIPAERINEIARTAAEQITEQAKDDPKVLTRLQQLAEKTGQISRRDFHRVGLNLNDLKLNATERKLLVSSFSPAAVQSAQQSFRAAQPLQLQAATEALAPTVEPPVEPEPQPSLPIVPPPAEPEVTQRRVGERAEPEAAPEPEMSAAAKEFERMTQEFMAQGSTEPATPVPNVVLRFHPTDETAAPSEKGTGVYAAPAEGAAYYARLRREQTGETGSITSYQVNPDANILRLDLRDYPGMTPGEIMVINEYGGLDQFRELMPQQRPKKEEKLRELIKDRLPDADPNQYQELPYGLLMDWFGAQLAREAGYDAIWLDARQPSTQEFLGLTDKAFLGKASTKELGPEEDPLVAAQTMQRVPREPTAPQRRAEEREPPTAPPATATTPTEVPVEDALNLRTANNTQLIDAIQNAAQTARNDSVTAIWEALQDNPAYENISISTFRRKIKEAGIRKDQIQKWHDQAKLQQAGFEVEPETGRATAQPREPEAPRYDDDESEKAYREALQKDEDIVEKLRREFEEEAAKKREKATRKKSENLAAQSSDRLTVRLGRLQDKAGQALDRGREKQAAKYQDEIDAITAELAKRVTPEDITAEDLTAEVEGERGKRKKPLVPSIVSREGGYVNPAVAAQLVQGKVTGTVAILGERPRKELKRAGQKIAAGFRSRGKHRPGTKGALEQREFDRKSAALEARFAVDEFRSALKKSYGVSRFAEIPESTAKHLNDVLAGRRSYDSVPEEIRKPIRKMRMHVDRLSRELLESGAIEGEIIGAFPAIPEGRRELINAIRDSIDINEPGAVDAVVEDLVEGGLPKNTAELVVTILANEGLYLNRSYEAFGDPKYLDRVPEETKNQFKHWIREQYPELSPSELTRRTDEILYEASEAGGPVQFLSRLNMSQKDLSILQRRKDLPDALRALLGERKNPIDNYIHTISKMSTLIATHKSLESIKTDGLKNGYIFDPKTGELPEAAIATFKPEESPRLAPLAGMKTFPEIKEALLETTRERNDNLFWKALFFAENMSQYAKTATSPMAAVRQIPSNMLIALANGHNPGEFLSSVRMSVSLLRGRDTGPQLQAFEPDIQQLASELNVSDTQAYLIDATRRGIVDENVDMGAIADRRNLDLVEELIEELGESKRAGGANLKRISDKIVKLPGSVYQSLDTVFKLAQYDGEIRMLKRAHPDFSIDAIRREAADIVRNTTPTYSKIPPFFQWIKRLPIGNFISFSTEVLRNDLNRTSLIVRELLTPGRRKMAARRIAGMASSKAMASALGATSMYALSMGAEDEEWMRRLGTPWNKFATFFHLGTDEKGSRRFVNLSYSDPFSQEKEVIRAARQDAGPAQIAFDLFGAIAGQYVAPKLVTKAVSQLHSNKDEYGIEIYNTEEPFGNQVIDGLAHIWKAVEPGAVSSVRRISKGYRGEVSGSKQYEFWPEVAAFGTGIRFETLDPRSSLYYKAADFSRAQPDVIKGFRDAVKDAVKTGVAEIQDPNERAAAMQAATAKMREEYQLAMTAHRTRFNDLVEDTEAALGLLKGYDFDELSAQDVLQQAGVGEDLASRITKNEYESYIPSSIDMIDAMILVADPDHREELVEARQNMIESRAYAATDNDPDTAMKNQRWLRRVGVSRPEQINYLIEKFKQDDINSAANRALKTLPMELRYDDEVRQNMKTLAEAALQDQPAKATDARRRRIGQIIGAAEGEK